MKIYIYGASGHGLVVADIAKACGYEEVIYIDDGENTFPTFDEIKKQNDIPIAFGIGVNGTRKKLFEKAVKHGFEVVTLVHPSAILSSTVTFGIGIVIMPNVVVNTLSHIGDFVHISPNTALAGEVTIKENTHIGIGSNIIQGITVGKNCIIGAGSVVVRDIKNNTLCYGNPCKIIKEIN